jgi:hypothetical protein
MSGITKEAVLVHDCWKAHFQTPVKKHQLCTAHLERETKYREERYKLLLTLGTLGTSNSRHWLVTYCLMCELSHEILFF